MEFTVTNYNGNERAVWKSTLKAGACYVNDRGYSSSSHFETERVVEGVDRGVEGGKAQ